MKYVKCRKCGDWIHFIPTKGGKSMPCNPMPKRYWEVEGGKQRIVLPDGEVIACELEGRPEDATGLGYIPHWATCKYAKEFKK